MKKIFILVGFLLLLSFTSGLSVEGNIRSACIDLGDLACLNIQFEPEINSVFTTIKNKYNQSIDVIVNLSILDRESNKIVNTLELNISNLPPNETISSAEDNIRLKDNFEASFFIHDLQIFTEGNSSVNFYNQMIDDFSFNITRLIKLDSWKKEISMSYLMNFEVDDEILLRKLIDGEMELHLPIEQGKLAYLNIDAITITSNNNIYFPLFYNYPNSEEIVIILDETIKKDETIKLNLKYSIGSSSKKRFLYLYPFSSIFFDLKSPLIGTNNPYIQMDNSFIENITEIGLYSVEMDLPQGYEYKETPLGCKNENIFGEKREICQGDSGMKIFQSDCSCDCFGEVETVDIATIIYGMTPIPTIEPTKVLWSSPITNNAPSGLSFHIRDVGLYRAVFSIFLILSIYYLFSLKNIGKNRGLEVMILYLSAYLLIRLSLKIPLAITLFEILVFITILGVIVINKWAKIAKYSKILLILINKLIHSCHRLVVDNI